MNLRDDNSVIGFRDYRRWLFPLALVLLGVALFFALGPPPRPMAAPASVPEAR
jgi:hypothetical protein